MKTYPDKIWLFEKTKHEYRLEVVYASDEKEFDRFIGKEVWLRIHRISELGLYKVSKEVYCRSQQVKESHENWQFETEQQASHHLYSLLMKLKSKYKTRILLKNRVK